MDVLTANGERIENALITVLHQKESVVEIDGGGKISVLPGVIDDQVHFREPGLTHKATIYTPKAKQQLPAGLLQFYGNAQYHTQCA